MIKNCRFYGAKLGPILKLLAKFLLMGYEREESINSN